MENLYIKSKSKSLKLPILLKNTNLRLKDKLRIEKKTIIQYAKKAVAHEGVNFTNIFEVTQYYDNVIDLLAEHIAELNISIE